MIIISLEQWPRLSCTYQFPSYISAYISRDRANKPCLVSTQESHCPRAGPSNDCGNARGEKAWNIPGSNIVSHLPPKDKMLKNGYHAKWSQPEMVLAVALCAHRTTAYQYPNTFIKFESASTNLSRRTQARTRATEKPARVTRTRGILCVHVEMACTESAKE